MKYIMGNWKMNKGIKETVEYFEKFNILLKPLSHISKIKKDIEERKIVIFPPALDFFYAKNASDDICNIGLQNIYYQDSGARTGENSPALARELGVEYVLVGHSERREYFKETEIDVSKKIVACKRNGITPILCIGEDEKIYEENKTLEFISAQLRENLKLLKADDTIKDKNIIIAYEPVWAIGTGKVCDVQQVSNICEHIIEIVGGILGIKVSVLYGGSINENNSGEFLKDKNISGLLVGGSSLNPDTFSKIIYSGHEMNK